jgi:hypothetical protein
MTTASTAKKPAPKAAPRKAATPKVKSTPFKSVADIKLGMTVRDPATGLTGIATFRSEQMSGTVQIAIVPQGDGSTIPEGHFVDDFMLEFVDDGVSARAPAADTTAKFRLGEKLKDTVTGLTGIAVDRTTYLNGCVHFSLMPEAKKEKEQPRASHFDHKRLIKVSDGLAVKASKEEPKPEFKRSTTGGPTRSLRGAGF